ncbi:MAG: DUF6242 domain-containing protein [Muribaculaceae bacterium]
MIRQLTICLAVVFATIVFAACNSDEPTTTDTASYSAAVKSFNFAEDDSVVTNLDSVFFSIDQKRCLIYNADSLPYGTDVTELVPEISTMTTVSLAELTVRRTGKADTVYNYLDNSTAKIDFTYPVKLRLVSYDGTTERNYTIQVNVRRQKADTLMWDRSERTPLPSLFEVPNEQHTTSTAAAVYCLTRYQQQYCLAVSKLNENVDGGLGEWQSQYVTFGFTPDINSFTATDTAFYILDSEGNLYFSTDGLQWEAAGEKLHYIYGAYHAEIVASRQEADGSWSLCTFPGGKAQPMPADMPYEKTSTSVVYGFEMTERQQLIVAGGRLLDGSLSQDTWGFDGSSWVKISRRKMPVALHSATLVPYYTVNVAKDWTTTRFATMLLVGGQLADGSLSRTVYVSTDFGINWSEASEQMQLPDYMPAFYGAQAVVVESTLYANSRVSRPIEQWQCPYIYLFGGHNINDATYNTMWRGVINRLTDKPIQ